MEQKGGGREVGKEEGRERENESEAINLLTLILLH